MPVRTQTVGLLFGLLFLALIAGCSGGGGTAAVSQNRHFGPLEMALTTTKATFARGEQVPLTFQVKNDSSQAVTAIGGGCLSLYQIIQGGQDITPGVGCAASGFSVTLAPGETKTYNIVLDQRDNNGNFLPAGQDTIKVWFTATNVNGTRMTDSEAQQNLAANPIQITVTP